MPKAHKTPAAAGTVEAIRLSLVELRRMFQRKELAELWEAAFGRSSHLDYTELRLLDAIAESSGEDGAGGKSGATVGDVSRRLGVDPSRASRQVARAVSKGLLARRVAQGDGRKVVLAITPRGAAIQQKGSALTRARIALALADWSAADRDRFALAFERFVQGMLPATEPSGASRTRRRPPA
jgi:DNA-binding MarR family transcriptional regulator